jgi:hypothetical protein
MNAVMNKAHNDEELSNFKPATSAVGKQNQFRLRNVNKQSAADRNIAFRRG